MGENAPERLRGRGPGVARRRRVSGFGGLQTRKHDAKVQLYAFDCLALDGDDLRKLPLSLRKTNLARLLFTAARWDLHRTAMWRFRGESPPSLKRCLVALVWSGSRNPPVAICLRGVSKGSKKNPPGLTGGLLNIVD
jgi:hypothetical protein